MSKALRDFLIIDQLHASRRSLVQRARRVADDAPVVLKGNGPEVPAEQALARYEHERAMLQSLQSDLVVKAYEIVRDGQRAVLVLEDVGGQSLRQCLGHGHLPLEEALNVAFRITEALCDVHEAGVFHRDINPNNIVYHRESRALKLIDFDIATTFRTSTRHVAVSGAMAGTLRYMAPEQTGRMNRGADQRADLYSLGMTLYELFTGVLPHDSDEPGALVHFHLAVEPTPPERVSATVPPVLSDLIMKLLAKAPEDRYQTASGLLADLEIMSGQLRDAGQVERFLLAAQDHSSRFEIPSRLYGRESEIQVLTDAHARVAGGRVETVLLSGPSGVGKSALVLQVANRLTERRGYFVKGSFNRRRRDVPYSALVDAFEDLATQLLEQPEGDQERWRDLIVRGTAPSVGVVLEAVPALQRLLGPQPPLPVLDAAGTQNRFNLTLQRFIQVFTKKAHPLVLLLDDMQWADAASLTLLTAVATSAKTESLLLIEAFDDTDLLEAHPLRRTVQEQERRGGHVLPLHLGALAPAHVAELLTEALHRERDAVAPVAELVWRKTEGNPFFIRQFLDALHENGHIVFSKASRRFEVDISSIEQAPITDNVAELLADKVRKLPAETQRLLPLAAAIGPEFDLRTLAAVADRTTMAAHLALEPAMQEELIVAASDPEYGQPRQGSATGNIFFTRFAFQHDRIQQAAYAVLPAEARAPLHLAIGRTLLASRAGTGEDRLFDIVGHLNRASELITDPHERADLVVLNLQAGNKARRSAAHTVAASHFRSAVALCRWEEDHAASYEAHLRLAESLYLATDFADALAVAGTMDRHALSGLERGELEGQRATIYLTLGDVGQCLACSRRAATALGLTLPEDPEAFSPELQIAMEELFERLGTAPVESLLDLPPMRHGETLVLMRVLTAALPAAYMTSPALFALLCARMVLLSLEHGNCAASAAGYGGLAVVLHSMGQERTGYRFGKLALAVSQRLDDMRMRATASFQFAICSAPWGEPLADSLPHLRRALQLALETGDYTMAGYSAGFTAVHGLLLGSPLTDLLAEGERNLALALELGDVLGAELLSHLCQLMHAYRGDLTTLESTGDNPAARFWFTQHQVEHRYLTGRLDEARDLAETAAALLPNVPASIGGPMLRFFQSLVLTAQWRRAASAAQVDWSETLTVNQQHLRHWSDLCPENYLAMYLLVEAERARLGLISTDPLDLYDQAIAAAADQRLLKIEAIANELAGAYWLAREKRPIALLYLARSRNLYAHWGASYKVDALEEAHPELAASGRSQGEHVLSTGGGPSASEAIDLASVVHAYQAISGEVVLDRLLAVMMRIILKNAGAPAGALLLDAEGTLLVQASKRAEDAEISVMIAVPLLEAPWPPKAIVQHVARTNESLVLDDAQRDHRFGDDAEIRACGAASILCMPVRHKSRLQGVLYLENHLVRGAFTRARLEGLTILVAQLAISLENASLFARQKQQADDLTRMNEGLRMEIAERQRAETELASYRDRLEERVIARTRELEESREQYRQIVESTKTVPFSYVPASGIFSYVGPQAEHLFAFPLECWKQPDFMEQLIPEEHLEQTRRRLESATVGEQFEFEGPACTADDRTLQVRWVVTCAEALGERHLHGLLLDVTERWQLESELAQAQKLESVGRLAAGVAHEINTPIQFVSDSVNFVRDAMKDLFEVLALYTALPPLLRDGGASQNALAAAAAAMEAEEENDIEYLVENVPRSLDRALDGLQRVAGIVRAMKQFAHLDRKEKSLVDLNQALQSTLTIAVSEYKYVADVETDLGEIPLVLCHAGEINQAVLNIVVNAAHAIADAVEGTGQRGTITVRTSLRADQVEIAIGDTGGGIPEAIRQRIFDPFFTTKAVGRGTGQGLAISRNVITDKHGGSLHFETESGLGTTFFIRLPVGDHPAAPPAP